jgi:hypothetical protein
LHNLSGEPPDAICAAWHGACLELIVSDGGAFDGAPNEVAVQPVGQIAAIEPVGPFPEIARQVLGADAVMGADEPGFDVAEQRMDDREERAGIGAPVLADSARSLRRKLAAAPSAKEGSVKARGVTVAAE